MLEYFNILFCTNDIILQQHSNVFVAFLLVMCRVGKRHKNPEELKKMAEEFLPKTTIPQGMICIYINNLNPNILNIGGFMCFPSDTVHAGRYSENKMKRQYFVVVTPFSR